LICTKKQGTGKYCTQFLEKIDVENKTFGVVKISTRNAQSVNMKSDKFKCFSDSLGTMGK
jgi:hypothetical protein